LSARWPDLDQEALRRSNRKQALVPEGATVLEPVGTAPGLVVPPSGDSGPTVVVLPGPPRELQPMWGAAVATGALRAALAGTGGLVAGRLTDLAGSSAYVLGGLVVYSNEAKTALAGVDPGLIAAHGAVSVEVAEALADGARAALGADVGVGITGIAGPGGGT